nr:PREDICTED: uncharacterized protein LOC109036422 [Bemisia tabaci]
MIAKLGIVWLTLCAIKAAKQKDENPLLAVLNSPFYVDKTLFIEVFHDTFTSPIYFTAPRGFGKTTNLRMLKAFYEINTSEDGTILKKEETETYKALQRARTIAATRAGRSPMDKFFNSYFGSQPVIYLTFKDIHHDRYNISMNSLKWLMIHAFKAHPYLNTSEKLTPEEKTLITQFSNNELHNDTVIENSGGILATLLSKHFDKPCLLLMDDFDALAIKMITYGSGHEEQIINSVQKFLNALLSDRKIVSRALLTGKTHLAGYYTPAGLVKHYQFGLHAVLTKFYGASVSEAREITKNRQVLYKLNYDYKGFTLTNTNYSRCIYDFETVVKFLENRNHTRVLDSVKFLEPVLADKGVRDRIELAIRMDRIPITLAKETDVRKCFVTMEKIYKYGQDLVDYENYKDYNDAYGMFQSKLDLQDSNRDCLFHYLNELGYFTVTKSDKAHLTLVIPDAAAYYTLGAQLERFWVGHLHTTNVTARDFVEAFMELSDEKSTLDDFAYSVNMVFKESPHRPNSTKDLRSPLFTFLATRVQDHPDLEIKCSEDQHTGQVDIQAVMQHKNPSWRQGVVLDFMYNNCNEADFAKHAKTKRYWGRIFKTVNIDTDVLTSLFVGICLSDNDVLEFRFFNTNKTHEHTYNVSRRIKHGWKAKKMLGKNH